MAGQGVWERAVREVLRASRELNPQAASWLEIIDAFEEAVAAGASVAELAALAATATDHTVGVIDEWTGARVVHPEVEDGARRLADVARLAVTERLRGRHAAELSLGSEHLLAVSVEAGLGRLGLVWLASDGKDWDPRDYLTVERLAAAVAGRALQTKRELIGEDPNEVEALERLLQGGLSEFELVQVVRHASLDPNRKYVVAALEPSPPNAIGPEGLGLIAQRYVMRCGSTARLVVVGHISCVVAVVSDELDRAFRDLGSSSSQRGFSIHAGIGNAVDLVDVAVSWRQAREALALRRMVAGEDEPAFFRDLGVLHLLGQIPHDEILADPLFDQVIAALTTQAVPSDLDLLELYLDEGSLRRAASKAYLHHTTVQHRLQRIQERLNIDLNDPRNRFEIQLIVKLYRVLIAQDGGSL